MSGDEARVFVKGKLVTLSEAAKLYGRTEASEQQHVRDREVRMGVQSRLVEGSFALQVEDWLLPNVEPYYRTRLGAAYLGDALELIKHLSDGSVDLIVTSPPFALIRKKAYGNVDPEEYVSWFEPFADQFWRVLRDDGNLVIHLGGSWNKGEPTKTLYTYQLLIALCSKYEKTFKLAQDFYWYNPARLPSPAEWVTVRRVRVKDAVDFIWWLSKGANPKADNRRVLKEYSESMLNLFKNGYKAKLRPSGHHISTKFGRDHGGAIPSNLLVYSNTDSNSRYLTMCRESGIEPHPARYPGQIPEFFMNFLTDRGEKVLDPFGGSNVTGEVAERLGRRWICFEILEEYLKGSMFRFYDEQFLSKP